MLFVAPFVAQFCNGSLYAWSILNPHIDSYIQGRSMDAMPPPPNRTESGPPAQMNNSVPPDEKAVVAFYSAASFLGFRLLVDQVVVLALLKSPIHDPNSFGLFQVVVFFLTFSYGGVIGIMPSLLTDMFGVYNSGTMHGIILTGWSICAIGGGLTFQHYFFKIKDSYPMEQMRDGEIAAYISNFHWLMVVACIGLALVPLVRTNPVDRFYPGYQYSIFGRPLIRFTKKDY
ncbi:hypothetical protein Ae201684P_000303 [Aphanomyces euteiches]|nr:hypothetical protein Ae201684P_000303 [Aphanomyces euteiches]